MTFIHILNYALKKVETKKTARMMMVDGSCPYFTDYDLCVCCTWLLVYASQHPPHWLPSLETHILSLTEPNGLLTTLHTTQLLQAEIIDLMLLSYVTLVLAGVAFRVVFGTAVVASPVASNAAVAASPVPYAAGVASPVA